MSFSFYLRNNKNTDGKYLAPIFTPYWLTIAHAASVPLAIE